MKKGTLYGVSVGPGDPEHLTLKAQRILNQVQIIATPRTANGTSRALAIVELIVDLLDKEIVYLDFAMAKNEQVLRDTHRRQADTLERYLAQGQDVAMLNIGDVSLFGTFCYVRDLVEQDGYSAVAIPGVTSFCAVAAELGQSLTTMGKPLTILPASFQEVGEELNRPGSKVLMKSGKALKQVKELLAQRGLAARSAMVVDCGLPEQKIYRDIMQSQDDEGYFVTILVSEPE